MQVERPRKPRGLVDSGLQLRVSGYVRKVRQAVTLVLIAEKMKRPKGSLMKHAMAVTLSLSTYIPQTQPGLGQPVVLGIGGSNYYLSCNGSPNSPLLDTEDELSDIHSDAVPSEVRDWLASTFTKKMEVARRRPDEKPKFRSIVHAVQAGIFVDRMFRKTSVLVGLTYPPAVVEVLKDVDKWSFNVFALNEAGGHALRFLVYELFTRYDLISRFRVPISALLNFVEALEVGYSKYKNPYHNLVHAADVTQTLHYFMVHTGLMHSLTELDIFAMVFAAAIHDFEHTGTTNNFHIQTR
ncbi:UNVERIFIED_CONTAM: hypothetical protein FKN15_074592 [Acipenser sinensis]